MKTVYARDDGRHGSMWPGDTLEAHRVLSLRGAKSQADALRESNHRLRARIPVKEQVEDLGLWAAEGSEVSVKVRSLYRLRRQREIESRVEAVIVCKSLLWHLVPTAPCPSVDVA